MLSELIRGLGSAISGRLAARVAEPSTRLPERPGEQGVRQVARFLRDHHLSAAQAASIYRVYGEEWPRVLEREPYRLARELAGLSFRGADKIARAMGVQDNAPARVETGILCALDQFSAQGHAFAPRGELVRAASRLLKRPPEIVDKAIRRMSLFGILVIEDEAVYQTHLYRAEVDSAKRLGELQANPYSALAELDAAEWSRVLRGFTKQSQIKLTPGQRVAIKRALNTKVSIVTGGPGTGKLTTVRALVYILNNTRHTFRVVAPTGGAAIDLGKAIGAPAITLRHLLGFKPQFPGSGTSSQTLNHPNGPGQLLRRPKNPIAADFIIVTHAEALDLLWMHCLLQAIHPASHLLFVGDPAQRPSTGPGQAIQDLIDSKLFPVTELELRPEPAESLRHTNAHRIRQGSSPLTPRTAQDWIMFREKEPEKAAARVLELVTAWLPAKFGFDPLVDIQVICPSRSGPSGADALNNLLQAALNPPSPDKPERRRGRNAFRVGDRVMQTRADYLKQVLFSDVGRIAAIDIKRQALTVDFGGGRVNYTFAECDELTHAFAIGVNRAYKSRAVVIPILQGDEATFNRSLLYTAVTGARELVIIVGARQALNLVIRNLGPGPRNSRLAARLKAAGFR